MNKEKFDFTTVYQRSGQDAKTLDAIPFDIGQQKEGFDLIPMWIADMNFPTAPSVVNAMSSRLGHPIFGYFEPREEYFEKIIHWQETHHGLTGLKPEYIGYENSVLGAVVSAVNIFTSKGDKVLLHSPTYVGFTRLLTENGLHLSHSPLVLDEQNIWRMDFADMERRIQEEKIHTVIFCSPHNPSGRVWEQWEVEQAMALFQKYDVSVVSDEIWSDLLLRGHKHIPLQTISDDARERTVALYAPSKTFNLAGLIGAYHIIYNQRIRDRVEKESSLSFYNHVNLMAMHALLGAYTTEGEAWLEELCDVLEENVTYGYEFFQTKVEGVFLSKPQGTYLLFIDCEEWCKKNQKTLEDLLMKGYEYGVLWQDGREFGGDYTLRLNVALPKSRLVEAFDRLEKYVFQGT